MVESVKLNGKDKIFLVASFFYILYIIFPLFSDYTHIPVYIPAFVVVTGVLISYPRAFFASSVKWFVTYIIILFLYYFVGRPVFINGMDQSLPALWRITIEAAWIIPSILIASVLSYRNEHRLYRIIGFGSIGLLMVSLIYILPLVMSSANILREGIMELDGIRPLGLPDYGLMHSYTLMLIPLCLMIRNNVGKYKIMAIVLLVLLFYMITQTAVTTSLFLSLFIFIFACLYDEKNGQKTFIAFLVVSVLLFILYKLGVFLWLVDSLMPFFEGTAVSYKLEDFHDSITTGTLTGGHIIGRIDLHSISRESFWNNPIFGGGIAGGHSKILDLLGATGLVVFIPFIMIIWKSYKSQISVVMQDKEAKAFITLCYVISFVFLYEKGLFGNSGWLFMTVLVPCAILGQRKSIYE